MPPKEEAVRAASPTWLHSPALPRIVPFALFMLFVAVGSLVPAPVPVPEGEWDARWIYALRAIVAGGACTDSDLPSPWR